ncbi:hypothetical protein FVE85_4077 [Porphyridium purpureum]|uniref:Glycosyltransferase family 92 protein n=1 Tax=Porphyridium purpureum TaxID=35688 RepID=A0A5J4YTD6_PORPP|nr:hypothetical protein FVE85_4077 [Porphyridium purpureum]|eukprot:POR0786..scf229_5
MELWEIYAQKLRTLLLDAYRRVPRRVWALSMTVLLALMLVVVPWWFATQAGLAPGASAAQVWEAHAATPMRYVTHIDGVQILREDRSGVDPQRAIDDDRDEDEDDAPARAADASGGVHEADGDGMAFVSALEKIEGPGWLHNSSASGSSARADEEMDHLDEQANGQNDDDDDDLETADQAHRSSTRNHISIMYPSRACVGSFVLEDGAGQTNSTSPIDPNRDPFVLHENAVIVRDVVLDRRWPIKKFLPTPEHGRMSVLISLGRNRRLVREHCEIRLKDMRRELPRKSIEIESILPLSKLTHGLKRYNDSDWILSAKLSPALVKGSSFKYPPKRFVVRLKLAVSSIETDATESSSANEQTPHTTWQHVFTGKFYLRCATEWDARDVNTAPILRKSPASCAEARGAAVLAGGALFGDSIFDGKQIANFAARSLLGRIFFDAVLVPVRPTHSVSKIQALCARDAEPDRAEQCAEDMHRENSDDLQRLAHKIEDELQELGVPSEFFDKIVLFSFCRLGSVPNSIEDSSGGPCDLSHYHGQSMALFAGHALFSGYFEWTVAYDIDEFLAPSKRWMERVSARNLLTRLRAEYGRAAFRFSWLNVVAPGVERMRNLSRIIMNGAISAPPRLVDMECQPSSECYKDFKFSKNSLGKVALDCRSGMVLNVHKVFRLAPGASSMDQLVAGMVEVGSEARTWHIRSEAREGLVGLCMYAPDPDVCPRTTVSADTSRERVPLQIARNEQHL